jgi:hypothetical protein
VRVRLLGEGRLEQRREVRVLVGLVLLVLVEQLLDLGLGGLPRLGRGGGRLLIAEKPGDLILSDGHLSNPQRSGWR